MASVEITGLKKNFGAVEVIHGVDLQIEDGEFVALVGPSGCGKSTLLRIISGLEPASGGEIRIDGTVVNHLNPRERNIAMVFQNYALYPHMSVRENIGYAMKVHGTPKAEIDARVDEAAQLLGLEPYLDRKPRNLSGGQRQRVAIGRALVRHPQVFLFDEPLSNLDAKLRVEMRTEIKLLQKRLGTTAVYVTHDQVEAMTMADRVVVMRAGVIEQVDAPIRLYEEPANRFVANFIGSPAMNFFEVATRDGAAWLDGQRLPLSSEAFARTGARERVTLGIRPEHMDGGDQPEALTLRCDTLEPLGAHTLVLGHIGGDKVVAQVAPRFPAEPGRDCTVQVDMSKAHFFDIDTETRL